MLEPGFNCYLIRHGQTVWNVEGRYQGCKNSGLTDLGREQARQVGRILSRHLGGRDPLPLHVSPLQRTRDTAEIIQNEVSFASVTLEPRIQETSFGDWEGLTNDEVLAGWPHLSAEIYARQAVMFAPNGEAYGAIVTRLRSWMADQKTPFVAVAHGVIGRIIRGLYLDLPVEVALQLPVPQDAVWHLCEGRAELLTQD